MRAPSCFAVAVRDSKNRIVIRDRPWRSIGEKLRVLRWPFLRGAVVLGESLANGMNALAYSAKIAAEGEESSPRSSVLGFQTGQEPDPTVGAPRRDASSASGPSAPGTRPSPGGLGPAWLPLPNRIWGRGRESELRTENRELRTAPPQAAPSFGWLFIPTLLFALLVFKGVPHTHGAGRRRVDRRARGLRLPLPRHRRRGEAAALRRLPAAHLAHEGDPAGLRLPRRRAQGDRDARGAGGADGGQRPGALALPPPLRHRFPALRHRQWASCSTCPSCPCSRRSSPRRGSTRRCSSCSRSSCSSPIAGLSYEAIRLSGKFGKNPVVRLLIGPGLLLQRLVTREPTDEQLRGSRWPRSPSPSPGGGHRGGARSRQGDRAPRARARLRLVRRLRRGAPGVGLRRRGRDRGGRAHGFSAMSPAR